MTVQKAGVAAALPFLLNPATVGVVAIGAVGWGLFKILRDEDEKEEVESVEAVIVEPKAIRTAPEVEAMKAKPDDLPAGSQPSASLQAGPEEESDPEACEEAAEAAQSEILRQAMSELGKRSAAARARRKAAASESVVIGGE